MALVKSGTGSIKVTSVLMIVTIERGLGYVWCALSARSEQDKKTVRSKHAPDGKTEKVKRPLNQKRYE